MIISLVMLKNMVSGEQNAVKAEGLADAVLSAL